MSQRFDPLGIGYVIVNGYAFKVMIRDFTFTMSPHEMNSISLEGLVLGQINQSDFTPEFMKDAPALPAPMKGNYIHDSLMSRK